MTGVDYPPPRARRDRGRSPRRRGARRALGIGLRALAVAGVFAAGVALGQALDDNPDPDRGRTEIRTLKPLPLPPAERTVTVTVTAP